MQKELDVAVLIEDEILLALPTVARHARLHAARRWAVCEGVTVFGVGRPARQGLMN
jgi:uncharacterized metal-binding protein YceD (DUF177 family)